MHFTKTKTNTRKPKTKPALHPALQAAIPVRTVMPLEAFLAEEPERVTLPYPGDCVALSVDNDASWAHLPPHDRTILAAAAKEPARYLGIITGVLTAPTETQPWCTCIVHILPPPKEPGGVILDYAPRPHTIVRLRPRTTPIARVPMLELAPPLLAQLLRGAKAVAATALGHAIMHCPTDAVGLGALLPERVRRVAAPARAVLYAPALDAYPVADFDYTWTGAHALSQRVLHEQHLISGNIMLARTLSVVAGSIPEPAAREEELRRVHGRLSALLQQRWVGARGGAAWATVVQRGLDGVARTHTHGAPPPVTSAYAQRRAMFMPPP